MIREGFARTEAELIRLRTDMDDRFARVDERFDRMDDRFVSLQRSLMMGLFGILAVLIAGLIALA